MFQNAVDPLSIIVLDQANDSPLAGVEVTYGSETATTDENGNAAFPNIDSSELLGTDISIGILQRGSSEPFTILVSVDSTNVTVRLDQVKQMLKI